MNSEINEILKDPEFRLKNWLRLVLRRFGGSSKQLADHLTAELDKWGAVIKTAGIKAQ